MRFLVLGFLALLLAAPMAGAQEDELPEVGGGPKGRFTKEQAQILALRAVPGEVTQSDGYWEDGRFFFEYTIQVRDGSIYEVEMYAATGRLFRIEIESLEPGAKLPHTLVSEEMVKAFALDHVFNETRGRRKAQLESSEIAVFQKKPAYRIIVKKSHRRYELIYDAVDGDLIRMDELG